MEAKFSNVEDAEQLNHALNAMSGVVGHGFFYQVASGAIITGKNEVKILHI